MRDRAGSKGSGMKLSHKVYYQVKPFIPRSVQIVVRRKVALGKRESYKHTWPIDEEASSSPREWSGWPERKKFAVVLMHDVDTVNGRRKCDKLIRLEKEMGFRSSFNFVPERYEAPVELRDYLVQEGFEVGVHGLKHDGKLFQSRKSFQKQAIRINHYLREWESVGFSSPSMIRNLDWIHELNKEYDASTFDTDPFEPQPDGVSTIFPFWVQNGYRGKGFVELPYTLPQDFTLFVLLKERDNLIWKKKLDWIVGKGGMALLNTHPDYMNFSKGRCKLEEYPSGLYEEFLDYVKGKYGGEYWQPLPREMARFWKEQMVAGQ
jgi:hypothetical protein